MVARPVAHWRPEARSVRSEDVSRGCERNGENNDEDARARGLDAVVRQDDGTSYTITPVRTNCGPPLITAPKLAADGSVYFFQKEPPTADCLDDDVFQALEWAPPGARNASPISIRSAFLVTANSDSLFFTNGTDDGSNTIWRVPRTGGSARRLFSTPQQVRELVADAQGVYYTAVVDNSTVEGKTYRLDLQTLENREIFPQRLFGLLVRDGFLYGGILRSPDVSPPLNLIRIKTINGHGFMFLARGHLPRNDFSVQTRTPFAVDDTYLYYHDAPSDSLMRVCR